MHAAIAVDGLTKRFGERIAFEDLTFTVEEGEVFGFLGPNGAGKTTTVRTLGTLFSPTSGRATVAGLELTEANAAAIRSRITVMTEAPGLYLRLTVTENLEFFAGLHGLTHPGDRIRAALKTVDLSSRADDLVGTLSKGLRQRVALARALLNEPQVMFLDEPTSGLDPVAAREVHELIEDLRKRDVTIFLTTHRLDEAERLCDRVAILKSRLLMVGTPDELRRNVFATTLELRTARPIEAPERLLGTIPGVTGWHQEGVSTYLLTVNDPEAVAPAVARALVAADADIIMLAESRRSLEDVYLQLIESDAEVTA